MVSGFVVCDVLYDFGKHRVVESPAFDNSGLVVGIQFQILSLRQRASRLLNGVEVPMSALRLLTMIGVPCALAILLSGCEPFGPAGKAQPSYVSGHGTSAPKASASAEERGRFVSTHHLLASTDLRSVCRYVVEAGGALLASAVTGEKMPAQGDQRDTFDVPKGTILDGIGGHTLLCVGFSNPGASL